MWTQAHGGGLENGRSNLNVLITSNVAFDRAVFSASSEAFEFTFFDPLKADLQNVPEPTMLVLSGVALLGLARRRRRQ